MKPIRFIALLTLATGSMAFAQTKPDAAAPVAVQATENAGLVIKGGEKIAFLGDSITRDGAALPGGYANLVISALKANGVTATAIPAGIGGDKSNQMLKRLEESVLSKKPDWMTLSCGVNDVWQGEKGIPLDQYKINITSIVDQAQAAGIKVMILTATMINEDAKNPNNIKLAGYNDFLRELAKEKNCLLADISADMQAMLKPGIKWKQLTRDGVHMNPRGDQMIASGVLRAFGMNESQLQKARDYWINMPGVACMVEGKPGLTLSQYKKLSDLAAKENRSVDEWVSTEMGKTLNAMLSAGSAK